MKTSSLEGRLFRPHQTAKMSNAEINKAYSELRSIANKRLQRQQAAGLGMRAREGFRFPTLQQIRESSKYSEEMMLNEVSKFLRSERTTVSGEKKFLNEFVAIMERDGYGSLVTNLDDIYNTLEYMDDLREKYGNKLFDSGDALDVLQQGQRLSIPIDELKENYDLFATNIKKMEKLKPPKEGKAFSQSRIEKLKEKWS